MDFVPAFRTAEFGVFRLDVSTGKLTKRGYKVKIQEQPLKVLTMLLERPGEIVHDLVRLCLDTGGDGKGIVIGVGCKLARNEGPAIDFHDVAVGCDGLGSVRDHQELDFAHTLVSQFEVG